MKFYKSISAVVITTSVLIGCTNSSNDGYPEFSSFPVIAMTELSGNYELMSPQSLFVVHRNILVSDNHDGKLMTIINLDSLNTSRRAVNVGNGPNEFLKVSNVKMSDNGKHLWIDDNLKRSISQYQISSGLRLGSDTFLGMQSYRGNANVLSVCPFEYGYFASGSFNGSSYVQFDLEFEPNEYFGDLPCDEDMASNKSYSMTHQSNIVSDCSGNYFCSAEVYCDRIEFYKKTDEGFRLTKSYATFDPDVDIFSQSVNGSEYVAVVENNNTVRGFRDVVIQSGSVYALYWGVKASEMNNPGNSCYVIEFSLDGAVLHGYKVDMLLRSIAIDENGVLFAINYSPDGQERVFFYDMSK